MNGVRILYSTRLVAAVMGSRFAISVPCYSFFDCCCVPDCMSTARPYFDTQVKLVPPCLAFCHVTTATSRITLSAGLIDRRFVGDNGANETQQESRGPPVRAEPARYLVHHNRASNCPTLPMTDLTRTAPSNLDAFPTLCSPVFDLM